MAAKSQAASASGASTSEPWREFQFSDGSSQKFWKIKLDGDSHTVNFGRLGTSGQAQTKTFADDAAARKDYEKLISQKTGKGYVEVGAAAAIANTAPIPAAKPAAKKGAKQAKQANADGASAEAADVAGPSNSTGSTPRNSGEVQREGTSTDVKSELRLEPRDWFWALWRDPEPLVRPEPPAFDQAKCVERIRKAKNSYWQMPWDSLIKSPSLSREEAEFWLVAMSTTGGTYNALPKLIADEVEPRKFTGKMTLEEIRKQVAGCMAKPEMALAVGTLLSPIEFYDLVTGSWKFKDRWQGEQEQPGWGSWMIPGYAHWVLPYLSRDERKDAQGYIRKQVKDLPHPTELHQSGLPVAPWMLAGIFGVTDVVERYLGGLVDKTYPANYASEEHVTVTMPLMGLGSAQDFAQHWRRLALSVNDFRKYGYWGELPVGNLMRAWLAHTELSGLDLVRETIAAQTNKDACDALLRQFCNLVAAPEAAPHMLELSQSCKTPQRATTWLNENLATAIAGLVGTAAKKDKLGAAAIEFLRDKQHEGHAAIIEEHVAKLPGDQAAAVRAALSGEGEKKYEPHDAQSTPQWLSAAIEEFASQKLPPGADFISLRRLPAVVIDGKKLNDEQVQRLLVALSRATVAQPPALFAKLKEHAERSTLDGFVWSIFDQWLSAAAPSKHKWAMTSLGHLGGDQVAIKLTPLVRKWPGESQHQRAVSGLECLRQIGSDTALMQLNGIAQKLKFKGLKTKAQEYMEEIAKAKGLTRSQLEDRIVPDCDLDERGSRVFDFGPRKFFFTLDSDMKPVVRDEAKKILKDLPKPGAKDDTAKASEAAADWKLLKAQLREVLKVQVGRLEQAMVTGRRWPVEEFEAFLVKHPLMINLARTVVWGTYDAQGKLQGTFRVTEEQDYADLKDNPYQLQDVASVGIVHPLHLDDASTKSWGEVFGDYAIAAPFPQLGRATFKLENGEEQQQEITRFNKPKIPPTALVGTLERLGWIRGIPEDGGVYHEHSKPFYGAEVTAIVQYEIGVPAGYIEGWDDQNITGCFFIPGIYAPNIYPDHKQRVALKDVDEVAISEVLSDLTLVASKGK